MATEMCLCYQTGLAAQVPLRAHPALERLEGAITQQSRILLFAGLAFSKGVILSKLCVSWTKKMKLVKKTPASLLIEWITCLGLCEPSH